MFPKTIRFLLIATILAGLAACAKKLGPADLAPGISPGEVYYTQFSLFQEKNRYRTTNYRRGSLIPINTPVILNSIDSKNIQITLRDSGQKITLENVQKHTGEDSQQAFKKILGKRKVDLSAFTPDEQTRILAGQVKAGMGRKAVLAALGYPPQTATASLELNDWTYWSSRYNRFIVRFRNDKVAEVVD
jgi:hypothetical protein